MRETGTFFAANLKDLLSISLRNFARTGDFGPVQLGDSREQVHLHLGLPEASPFSPKKENQDCYGCFELQFSQDGNLISICNPSLHPGFGHFGNHHFENDYFQVDPWFLTEKIWRLHAVTEALLLEGHSFTIEKQEEGPAICFASGVQFRFSKHEHHGRIGSNEHAELYYLGLGPEN